MQNSLLEMQDYWDTVECCIYVYLKQELSGK